MAPPEQDRHEVERDGAKDHGVRADVGQTSRQRRPGYRWALCNRGRAEPDRQDKTAGQGETGGCCAKHDRRPEGIEKAARRRPEDRSALPERGVPGDGRTEQGAWHQRWQQGLQRRIGEGTTGADDDDEAVDRPKGRGAEMRR